MDWNRKLATVTRNVLVLRVEALDTNTTASESQLANDIFGTDGDVVNLKSQFQKCSYGQVIIEPLTSNILVGTDGVYTVRLPNITVFNATDSAIANEVVKQAAVDFGIHPSRLANHVMVCLPPGTFGRWIASANLNSWRTLYNDKWCQYLSTQMHEIGK